MSAYQLLFIGIAILAVVGIIYWIKIGGQSDKEHKWWKLFTIILTICFFLFPNDCWAGGGGDPRFAVVMYLSGLPALVVGLLAFAKGRNISLSRRVAQLVGAVAMIEISGYAAFSILHASFLSAWGFAAMVGPAIVYLYVLDRIQRT